MKCERGIGASHVSPEVTVVLGKVEVPSYIIGGGSAGTGRRGVKSGGGGVAGQSTP